MSVFTCNLSADRFVRAYRAASSETTRYYLCGVQIEPDPAGDGALLVATDGRIMLCLRDLSAQIEGSAIVQADKPTLAAARHKKADRVVVADNQLRVLDQQGQVLHIQAGPALVDGSFPDWRRVFPRETAKRVALDGFDSDLLANLGAALCAGKTPYVALFGDEPLSPALVVGTLENAFGVLMPARHEPVVDTSWIDLPAASEAA